VLFFAVVVALLVAPAYSQWTSCSTSNSEMSISSISVPVEPSEGQPFSITVDGVLHSVVTKGTVYGETYYEGISLGTKSSDLCTDMKGSKTPCPWQKGPMSFVSNGTMANNIPSGQYKEVIWITDTQTGKQVFCIQGVFTLN